MKLGIYGYGNLGKGVENAIARNADMELAAVFTRRDPGSLTIGRPHRRADALRRLRHGPAHHDPVPGEALQRRGFL